MTPALADTPRRRPVFIRRVALGAIAAALFTCSCAGAAYAQDGPKRLRLFNRPPGANTAEPKDWLPKGTVLRVYREEAPNAKGRPVNPDSAPSGKTAVIDTVAGDSGATHSTYGVAGKRDRYLVYALTPDGKLLWSVQPRTGEQPYFHTLDSLPQIRMSAVASSRAAVIGALLAPTGTSEATIPAGPEGKPRPEPPGSRVPGGRKWFTLEGLVALVLGMAIGWSARHFRLHSRFRKAVVDRKPGSQEGRGQEPQPASDPVTWDQFASRMRSLEEKLSQHITEQVTSSEQLLLRSVQGMVAQARPAEPDRGEEKALAGQQQRRTGPQHSESEPPRQGGKDSSASGWLEAIFVGWCREAQGNVGSVNDFAEALRDRQPGAAVTLLYRDGNSNEVKFVSDGARDPIEYWLVTTTRQSMLLPRPLNRSKFRELSPIFTGSAAPATIRSIESARVRRDGDYWVLLSQGSVQ